MESPNRLTAGGGEDRFRRLIDIGASLLSELDLEAVLRSVVEAARELTGSRYAALGVLDRDRTELERFVYLDDETKRGIGFPPGDPPTNSFLAVAIEIRGEAFGNLYMTEKEGAEEFGEADEEAAATLATWAGIAIENARLYTRLRERETDLAQALRQAEASVDIARTVGGEVDVERVLGLIVKRARALVEARTLLVLLHRGERMVLAAQAGRIGPEVERISGLPVEDSVFQQAMRERVAQHLGRGAPPSETEVRERFGAESALVVPLLFRGRAVGALLALDREAGGVDFDEEDLRLLQAFAASAATAVATAQGVEAERLQQRVEIGERERERWARELHDETLQGLAAIRIELATALQSEAADRAERIESAAAATIDRLEGQITDLSRLINDLRPAALERQGLGAALATLAEDAAERGGFAVETEIDLDGELSHDEERVVYRLAQEALQNAVRHSAASRVTLTVQLDGEEVRVAIRDDGAGFDPAARKGRGLLGMEERVALLGGRLAVESAPARGTEVRATLPVSGC